MTVENTTNKQAAQVMGSATYDFTFRCLAKDPTETAAKEAIKCIVADSDGNETTLVYGTDYSVSLDADGIGGTVTVVNSRDSTYTITIMREYQLKQDIVLNDFDEFAAKTLEGSLDKLTMIEQQNQEQLTRSVKVGVTSSVDTDELVQQVERIYTSIDNVDTVADDISNVNSVAGISTNINTVAGNNTNINAVAGISASVTTVAGIASDVTTVAGIASDVTAVKNNATNINAVSADLTNVDVVAGIATDISTCSTNMTAIQEAPAAATAASTSATNAQQYAQDTKGFAPIGSLLPLNCTADYIPDGCLPCDGYEYSQSQFPTLWTNYLTSSPVKLQTCTYAEYATAISSYGFCDKFAVDTTALTFKVPTRPNKAYIGVNSTAPVVGNGKTLGVTDGGTNKYGLFMTPDYRMSRAVAGLYNQNIGTSPSGGEMATNKGFGVVTSGESGLIADTSNLIKESTDIRWFVVVANAQINQSQMDWSAWASSLAGKANTDLSNITATGKETVVGWGMPDYSAGVSISFSKSMTTTGQTYIAPSDGVIYFSNLENVAIDTFSVYVNNILIASLGDDGSQASWKSVNVRVSKGDIFKISSQANYTSAELISKFFPLKGVN